MEVWGNAPTTNIKKTKQFVAHFDMICLKIVDQNDLII